MRVNSGVDEHKGMVSPAQHTHTGEASAGKALEGQDNLNSPLWRSLRADVVSVWGCVDSREVPREVPSGVDVKETPSGLCFSTSPEVWLVSSP